MKKKHIICIVFFAILILVIFCVNKYKDSLSLTRIVQSLAIFTVYTEDYIKNEEQQDWRGLMLDYCVNARNTKGIRNFEKIKHGCNFTGANGTYWQINYIEGIATISSEKENSTYSVKMGICKNGTVNCKEEFPMAYKIKKASKRSINYYSNKLRQGEK